MKMRMAFVASIGSSRKETLSAVQAMLHTGDFFEELIYLAHRFPDLISEILDLTDGGWFLTVLLVDPFHLCLVVGIAKPDGRTQCVVMWELAERRALAEGLNRLLPVGFGFLRTIKQLLCNYGRTKF